MNVAKPVLAGIGALTVAGVGGTVGLMRIQDGINERNPSGSEADGPSEAWSWGAVGAGTAAMLGGFALSLFDRNLAGAITAGAGVGLLTAGLVSGLTMESRYGIGVETQFDHIMSTYDDGDDGKIHLDDGGFWKGRETRNTTTSQVKVGDVWTTTTTTTSMARLGEAADTNEDRIADADELHTKIASYDDDSNGRIVGPEHDRYENEVGED